MSVCVCMCVYGSSGFRVICVHTDNHANILQCVPRQGAGLPKSWNKHVTFVFDFLYKLIVRGFYLNKQKRNQESADICFEEWENWIRVLLTNRTARTNIYSEMQKKKGHILLFTYTYL